MRSERKQAAEREIDFNAYDPIFERWAGNDGVGFYVGNERFGWWCLEAVPPHRTIGAGRRLCPLPRGWTFVANWTRDR